MGDMWLLLDAGAARCVLTFHWQLAEARGHLGDRALGGCVRTGPARCRRRARERCAAAGARGPGPPAGAGVRGDSRRRRGPRAARRRRRTRCAAAPQELARGGTPAGSGFNRDGPHARRRRATARPGVSGNAARRRRCRRSRWRSAARFQFEPTVISGVDDPVPIRRPTDRVLQARRHRHGGCRRRDRRIPGGRDADVRDRAGLGQGPAAAPGRSCAGPNEAAVALARPGVPCPRAASCRGPGRDIETRGSRSCSALGHGIGLAALI